MLRTSRMLCWGRLALPLLLSLTLGILSATPARALPISLFFDPVTPDVAPGAGFSVAPSDPVAVEVWIAGLDSGSGSAPNLGSFDVTVAFTNLALQGVGFGTELGAPSSFQSTPATAPGEVRALEVSLLNDPVFFAAQPSSFRLFTLSFTAGAPGAGSLSFSNLLIGDEFGGSLVDPSLVLGTQTFQVVPEPGSAWLVGAGLAGLATLRRRRRAAAGPAAG